LNKVNNKGLSGFPVTAPMTFFQAYSLLNAGIKPLHGLITVFGAALLTLCDKSVTFTIVKESIKSEGKQYDCEKVQPAFCDVFFRGGKSWRFVITSCRIV
jgi:hypothetical protein